MLRVIYINIWTDIHKHSVQIEISCQQISDNQRQSKELFTVEDQYTIKLQWLEHVSDHENLFEIWVHVVEPLMLNHGARSGSKIDNIGKSFFIFLHNKCMSSILKNHTYNIQFRIKIRKFP